MTDQHDSLANDVAVHASFFHRLAQRPTRVSLIGVLMSSILVFILGWATWESESRLGFAQLADSLVDVGTAAALLWALRVADTPADRGHPHGHQPAEPIAALVVAIFAGITGAQVVRSAVQAWIDGATPSLTSNLAWAFVVKVVAKAGLVWLCRSSDRVQPSPALRALAIDARNDVLTSTVALLGFFAARSGWVAFDAWLALPLGLWIAWSGFRLAQENIAFLMGQSAPDDRVEEIRRLVLADPQVKRCEQVVARHHGSVYTVTVRVEAAPELGVPELSVLRQRLTQRLSQESDVGHAEVHIDIPLEWSSND